MALYISLAAWKAIAILFHSMAISSTTFRMYRRIKMRNMWWDDFSALAAIILDLVYTSTIFFRDFDTPLTPEQRGRKIVLFWLTGTLPPLVVWLSRISICLSIARIDVQNTAIRIRPWNYALIIGFALIAGAMFFQKIWVCTGSTKWQDTQTVYCYVGETAGYISLTGDLLADSILTAISFRLLWKVHMRRSQRRLLSWLFAANIWSSLAGIAYGVVVINSSKLGSARGILIGIVVHIKTSTTLTVANLVVVVTYFYARFRRRSSGSDSDSDSDSAPNTRRNSNLPDGRTTKDSGAGRQNTLLILTELDSNGSVISWDQQGRGRMTTTFMTYASTDLRSLPRLPPRALEKDGSHRRASISVPSYSSGDWHMHALSRSVSEPSSSSRSHRVFDS